MHIHWLSFVLVMLYALLVDLVLLPSIAYHFALSSPSLFFSLWLPDDTTVPAIGIVRDRHTLLWRAVHLCPRTANPRPGLARPVSGHLRRSALLRVVFLSRSERRSLGCVEDVLRDVLVLGHCLLESVLCQFCHPLL